MSKIEYKETTNTVVLCIIDIYDFGLIGGIHFFYWNDSAIGWIKT